MRHMRCNQEGSGKEEAAGQAGAEVKSPCFVREGDLSITLHTVVG